MKYTFLLIFLFSFQLSSAQSDTSKVEADTVLNRQEEPDTLKRAFSAPMTKSPTGAIIRSLVLPGLGQLYVENYWKAPLMLGGFGTTVGIMLWNHDQYVQAQDDLENYEGDEQRELNRLKDRRTFFRDQRDMTGLYVLGVYVIAAVDAYVGAHLYDFSVDDDLSLSVQPDHLKGVCIIFSYRF